MQKQRIKSVAVVNKKEPIAVSPVQVLPPKTTHEENVVTMGQRRINLIWEITQAAIALMVTGALIYTSIKKIDAPELKNAFFLIIGFYFSRTNHTAIGGTGKKTLPSDSGTR